MFKWIKRMFREHPYASTAVTVAILGIASATANLAINGKQVTLPVEKLAGNIVPDAPSITNTVPQMVSVEVDGVIKTFPREQFIRQLHEGWTHSSAKAAEAASMGLELKPSETIVNACIVKMKNVG